jgi:hypothetical protein
MIESITGRGAMTATGRAVVRNGGRGQGPGFQVDADVETAEAGGAARAAAPTSVQGMLVLQEEFVAEPPDRRARRRGHDLLRALTGLQRDLLGGGVDPASLRRLANLLADVPAADDPTLRGDIDAVVLRARIELWRHGGAAEP